MAPQAARVWMDSLELLAQQGLQVLLVPLVVMVCLA